MSHTGFRHVIMRHDKAATYGSRQLKDQEKNYLMHDLELGAVIFGLKFDETSCMMKMLIFIRTLKI